MTLLLLAWLDLSKFISPPSSSSRPSSSEPSPRSNSSPGNKPKHAKRRHRGLVGSGGIFPNSHEQEFAYEHESLGKTVEARKGFGVWMQPR